MGVMEDIPAHPSPVSLHDTETDTNIVDSQLESNIEVLDYANWMGSGLKSGYGFHALQQQVDASPFLF
jgi:hypothetical protein